MTDHRAATVRFDHVSKHYDRTTVGRTPGAVNDLDLEIPAGRICVLVGPSGCGKTTSLKLVNRLIEPTSGRVLLDGVDVATREVTELRRGIGYVIQQVGLLPHQTVEENVTTVPRLLGWPAERRRARAEELLGMVGLDPATYAGRFPAQLSGGERQRVGVARALAVDPPVMLMDEPFGAVDPIVRDRLQNELLRLQEDLAKTIIFVTHDIDEAIKMGDLVAVMETGGRVAQFGPPADILARPASEFVARFVGADRGLKRLSLFRVGDVPLEMPVTARPGDAAGPAAERVRAAGSGELLLVDEADRPVGWVPVERLPADGPVEVGHADPSSPAVDRRTTLKDALSMLLDQTARTAVVVDRDGRMRGVLTIATVIDWMRDARSAEPPASGPDAPGSAARGSAGERVGEP
jgi:osmoprotectant transport system ATP-binding protein